MSKIFSFLKPYRLHMAVALILMLVELVVELWQPLLMAKIIDEGVLKKDLNLVIYWGGVMLGVSALAFAAGIINSFYAGHASQSFGFDIRKALFEKVQSFSFSNFDRFSTSSLVTRMTNDVTMIQNTVFMSLRIMLRAPLLIVGGLIMAILVDVKLGLILAGVTPLLVLFLAWVRTRARGLFLSMQKNLDRVNSVLRENLIAMRLIKAFLRGKHEIGRFTDSNERLKKKTVSAFRLIEYTTPVLMLAMNAGILAVLWFGNIEVANGDIKVGEVVAIINYGTRITSALSIVSMIIMIFSRARASSQRIAEVFDTDIDLLDAPAALKEETVPFGKIEFRNVFFQYPGTKRPILENVSFTVKPGETLAILGATGSGKTTLFQLIPRLYDVTRGEILLDGTNIRDMKLDKLRRQIGYVPQDVLLFTGTVAENISWGKEDASKKEIIEAAKNAQIHDSIEKFPKGYESKIGQKGVNLSGGQKQRISIARALVRKPKILLLDDSTSALDMKTETNLLKDLYQYNCTTLIITQKITTAISADSILLLEEGKIKAAGSHSALLRTEPLYRRIYETQLEEGNQSYAEGFN
ncbi:ABC transporter ATP-binding protein [Neobacillus notoginsengisoli]|uniref:ABC transporter ATP-binding protein n=1 Tax=Neobacillus notoginsengisoli TaxID=1578198 RepID=A0A417YVW8_9BACI|nr:ABC transporter ATP-binding protein [Neobacillus notoginsengisoli]RHW41496.1 ABC transporter ATP-binding protein [Neobacillus notoginsengisoli]